MATQNLQRDFVRSFATEEGNRHILGAGAQQTELKRMFIRYGLALAAIGVALGLGATAPVMLLMKSLLFGVSPVDPMTYIVVALLLTAVIVSPVIYQREGLGR